MNIVPTCLVITSNESASSIETQFVSMCSELKANINSINLILDEKKCATTKYAIEHIQTKIKEALNLPMGSDIEMNKYAGPTVLGKDDDVSGDEVMLEIPRDSSSEEEMEDQSGENGLEGGPNEGADNGKMAVNESNIVSSNHVSTLMEPSSMCVDEDSSRRNPVPPNV